MDHNSHINVYTIIENPHSRQKYWWEDYFFTYSWSLPPWGIVVLQSILQYHRSWAIVCAFFEPAPRFVKFFLYTVSPYLSSTPILMETSWFCLEFLFRNLASFIRNTSLQHFSILLSRASTYRLANCLFWFFLLLRGDTSFLSLVYLFPGWRLVYPWFTDVRKCRDIRGVVYRYPGFWRCFCFTYN